MTALHEKATKIAIRGTQWRNYKKSHKATKAAAETHKTTEKWVRASITLVDKKFVDAPRKILSAARNYLEGSTAGAADGKFIGGLLTWEDGYRILPNLLNEQVMRNLGQFKSEFLDAVAELRAVLPTAIDAARSENPDLFSAADYGASYVKSSSVDDIVDRYSFEIDRGRLPEPGQGDFRIDNSDEAQEAARAADEEKSIGKAREMRDHVVGTVISVAEHFAERCEVFDPEDKGKSPFRDSTVEKVRDLIGVLPALNIDNDARIEKARQGLIDALGDKSAKELRESDNAREDTAAKARAVADNISNLFD
jgi:hypothetical protein